MMMLCFSLDAFIFLVRGMDPGFIKLNDLESICIFYIPYDCLRLVP